MAEYIYEILFMSDCKHSRIFRAVDPPCDILSPVEFIFTQM